MFIQAPWPRTVRLRKHGISEIFLLQDKLMASLSEQLCAIIGRRGCGEQTARLAELYPRQLGVRSERMTRAKMREARARGDVWLDLVEILEASRYSDTRSIDEHHCEPV